MEYLSDQEIIPFPNIDYNQFKGQSVPIVIDWGAYHSRVGFASESSPQLVFRSLLSKQRAKKDSEILIGNEIVDIEAVKRVLRSPFEFDVVTQFDTMESIFDYMFINLGIDSNCVEHPIVLNEALCTPLWSRFNAQELLFECYGIPSLLLGVDHLFSLYHNFCDIDNCLIICLGHYTCHMTVVKDGTVCCDGSKRINLGGLNLSLYLQRLLQLKYPKLTQEFTFTKCEQIVQKLCKFSIDYDFESSQWSREDFYRQNIKQFKASVATKVNPTIINENFTDRSKRLLQKVENNLFKRRENQLSELEENKKKSKTLLELVEDEELADPMLIARAYQNTGVRNLNELRNKLNEINAEIKQIKEQINPKIATKSTVIDEIKEWQRNSSYDESQWISYIKEMRRNRIGENAWILNELFREYELETKRLKRHGIADNIIELGPELIRIPELFFSPNALINYPQMGITEAIETIVKELDPKITETIFLTGGCANIDGIVERIESDVTAIRPFQSPLKVIKAGDVSTDGWRGGRDSSLKFLDKFVSKAEYNEFGAGYIKEFKCSNRFKS